MNLYQVTFNPDGTVLSVQPLPEEPEKRRILFVRATDTTKAEKTAKALYSLAK